MPKKKRVENCKYLPANLKNRRIAMGLKQEDLARALGLDRTSITYYEQGAHEPSIMMLVRIAKILQTDVLTLISPPKAGTLYDRRYVTRTHEKNMETAASFASPGSKYNPDGNNGGDLFEEKEASPLPQHTLPLMTKQEIDVITLMRQLEPKQAEEVIALIKKMDDENKNNSLV